MAGCFAQFSVIWPDATIPHTPPINFQHITRPPLAHLMLIFNISRAQGKLMISPNRLRINFTAETEANGARHLGMNIPATRQAQCKRAIKLAMP